MIYCCFGSEAILLDIINTETQTILDVALSS